MDRREGGSYIRQGPLFPRASNPPRIKSVAKIIPTS
jgi:hypothetical protein